MSESYLSEILYQIKQTRIDIANLNKKIDNDFEKLQHNCSSQNTIKKGIDIYIGAIPLETQNYKPKSVCGCLLTIKKNSPVSDIRVVNKDINNAELLALTMALEQLSMHIGANEKVKIITAFEPTCNVLNNKKLYKNLSKQLKEETQKTLQKFNYQILCNKEATEIEFLYESLLEVAKKIKEK